MVLLQCNDMRRYRVSLDLLPILARLEDWVSLEALVANGVALSGRDLALLVDKGIIETCAYGETMAPPSFWSSVELAVHRQQNGATAPRPGPAPELTFTSRGSGDVIVLPDPGELPTSLGEVLRRRRSKRRFGPGPVRQIDLSTLLYHSVRVEKIVNDPQAGGMALRPFPTAGGRSELEVYIVANDLDGAAPGVYHYSPATHSLSAIRLRDGDQDRFNEEVNASTGGVLNRDPPVVLLITAVFGRVMWKYPGIGLSLIYKDTGCLFQTVYLVATAIGLAPCAIGGGPEARNARWLGLDPSEESQVGAFLLGPPIGATLEPR